MLGTEPCVAIPNWQRISVHRLGKQYRTHDDRFVYVNDLGWFVYVRAELLELPGLIAHSGLLGPFDDRAVARHRLQEYLQSESM